MPKGLKETSSTVSIGFSVVETAPNTFVQGSVDLNLSPLDREVFVVQGIDLNPTAPDALAGVDTATSCSLTTTSQTSVQTLANSNCMADSVLNIRAAGFVDSGVGFARIAQEAPATLLEYIGIICYQCLLCSTPRYCKRSSKGCYRQIVRIPRTCGC